MLGLVRKILGLLTISMVILFFASWASAGYSSGWTIVFAFSAGAVAIDDYAIYGIQMLKAVRTN